jgi:hypothetical protein
MALGKERDTLSADVGNALSSSITIRDNQIRIRDWT